MKRIYIDNDIGLKLAHYGILRSLVKYSLENEYELFTLQSLKYIAKKYSEKHSSNIDEFAFMEQIDYLVSVSTQPNLDLKTIELLQDIQHSDIDEGELTLIGGALDNSGCIVTGDKRAIRASHQFVKGEPVNLAGLSFVTLEQTIRIALKLFGDSALQSIQNVSNVDSAIRACVNSSNVGDIFAGLDSYINELKSSCNQFQFCNS